LNLSLLENLNLSFLENLNHSLLENLNLSLLENEIQKILAQRPAIPGEAGQPLIVPESCGSHIS
jgi:hypothetical protein